MLESTLDLHAQYAHAQCWLLSMGALHVNASLLKGKQVHEETLCRISARYCFKRSVYMAYMRDTVRLVTRRNRLRTVLPRAGACCTALKSAFASALTAQIQLKIFQRCPSGRLRVPPG